MIISKITAFIYRKQCAEIVNHLRLAVCEWQSHRLEDNYIQIKLTIICDYILLNSNKIGTYCLGTNEMQRRR